MDFSFRYNCWDIMNCDNQECHARREPETPCWEIAKRSNSFQNFSNTCDDCIVFIFKNNLTFFSTEKGQKFINQRTLLGNSEAGHQVCASKANATG